MYDVCTNKMISFEYESFFPQNFEYKLQKRKKIVHLTENMVKGTNILILNNIRNVLN